MVIVKPTKHSHPYDSKTSIQCNLMKQTTLENIPNSSHIGRNYNAVN